MNFIFDIGNVLVDFKPEQFLHNLIGNQYFEEKMLEVIFRRPEWIRLDEGTISQEEAYSRFCTKEPEYQELIKIIMNNLHNMLTPMDSTIELLPKIKASNNKLYYLSNYHKKLSNYILAKYSFFEMFDGGVFSCDIHSLKPNPKIYHHLLDKYSLQPKDCIFFDDTAVNVSAANKLGIKGVLFIVADDVRKHIY